jgi:hypothetical protein
MVGYLFRSPNMSYRNRRALGDPGPIELFYILDHLDCWEYMHFYEAVSGLEVVKINGLAIFVQ